MRYYRTLGAVLAAGVMLAACTKQGGSDPGANGSVARQGATSSASMSVSSIASTHATNPARFAALPDRGELLHYDAQAPVRDGAYTWHRTELSEQHALDAIKGGVLRVVTPTGQLLGFQYDRSVRHDESGDWTWIGHLPGHEGVQAILTFGKDAVFGSIGQPDMRPLRLTTQGGASWLVETDPTQLAGLASRAANPVSSDYKIVTPAVLERLRRLRPSAAGMKASTSTSTPTAASATATATPTVDLLIGYTQGFVAAKGSTSAVVTRLNSMVDTANVGLRNSQVNGQIRLVHTMQVSYTDTNTNDATLGQLTGYDSDTQKETTPNAAFNALRAARETYKADLVSLVRPFKEPEQDSCGIAWLVGGGKQGDTVTATSGWDYFGYSVVSDGTDRNETDGKTYFCEEHTLAHELGHNMGSAHDRATSKGDDGVLDDPDDYGAFAYSFGYKPAAFYTIMAYGDKGQTSYLVFSNPRITLCGGVACGVVNSEDNAQSLGKLLPKVAQFRAAVDTGQGNPVESDFNGDGKADILWRNASTGANVIWKSAIGSARQTVSSAAVAWSVAGIGDFDGDGVSDILWRNRGSGQDVVWYSANSSTPVSLATVADTAWAVAGIGDFDNDGKSDILWHHSATGTNIIWRSGNASTRKSVPTTKSGWFVAGTGDFDGDGEADILWRNSGSGQNVIWYSANASTGQTLTKIADPAWIVAGIGDFDGDGKSDILWHYGTGLNVIWRSGSYAARQSVATSGKGWNVAATRDYDGDGKSDILWRNASSGANVIWKSANSSTTQAVSTVADQHWVVAN